MGGKSAGIRQQLVLMRCQELFAFKGFQGERLCVGSQGARVICPRDQLELQLTCTAIWPILLAQHSTAQHSTAQRSTA